MKSAFKKIGGGIFLSLIIILLSFTQLKPIQEQQLIIGTWNYVGETNNKWIFTNDRCSWEYNGNLIDTFTYQITEDAADNGVVFSYLILQNVDNNDVYYYEINALTEDNLALDYQGDLNEKLMLFEK